MPIKTEVIGTAEFKAKPEDIDIDKAWADAKKWMSGVGISTTSRPDADKIRAAMAKQKKAATFVATFDGSKGLKIDARVGSTVVEQETDQYIDGGGQKQWREALERLKKGSKLVTDADLKAWDAKHPDPEEAARLRQREDTLMKEIKVIQIQIQRAQVQLKPKAEELLKVQQAIKKLGG
jgi:hypothetical protein